METEDVTIVAIAKDTFFRFAVDGKEEGGFTLV